MANRDVETIRSRARFVATLRRVADAIERAEPVRIQVAKKRLVAPASATLSIEHEVAGAEEELELQLRWRNVPESPRPPAPDRRRKSPARRKSTRAKR